jgi:CDP-L-myo-inositol myo-inositolphosphotransferase
MKTIILAAGSGTRLRAEGLATPKPLMPLGGLSLLERAIRTALKAGSSEVLVVLGAYADQVRSTIEPRVKELPVRFVVNDQWEKGNGTSVLAARPLLGSESALILMADHLLFARTLTALMERSKGGDNWMAIDRKRVVVDLDDATKVRLSDGLIVEVGKTLSPYDAIDIGAAVCSPELFDALEKAQTESGGACSHSEGMKRLAAAKRLQAHDIGDDRWEDVDSVAAHRAGEELLFQSLRKSTDGLMSRLLERRLSMTVTKLLMNYPVSPNAVTIAVVLIGAVAAWCFAQPGYGIKVIASLIFWCASFLDGCDGELARLKFAESKIGGWLDLWADNVVHCMVFIGIGLGLARDTGNDQWTSLGFAAALGVIFSVSWVSVTSVRKKKGSGPLYTSVAAGEGEKAKAGGVGRLVKLADALSRRDFIFGVIFLAVLGWLPGFLWAAAIGSHLYFLVLVSIYLLSRSERV